MKTNSDTYVMLLTSLPRPGPLFIAKRPPLSRLKLEQRLRVLTPEDAEKLSLIEKVLSWSLLPLSASEEDVLNRGQKAMEQLEDKTLRDIVQTRLEIRTCVAALRRRERGELAPTANTVWGFGGKVGRIGASSVSYTHTTLPKKRKGESSRGSVQPQKKQTK